MVVPILTNFILVMPLTRFAVPGASYVLKPETSLAKLLRFSPQMDLGAWIAGHALSSALCCLVHSRALERSLRGFL